MCKTEDNRVSSPLERTKWALIPEKRMNGKGGKADRRRLLQEGILFSFLSSRENSLYSIFCIHFQYKWRSPLFLVSFLRCVVYSFCSSELDFRPCYFFFLLLLLLWLQQRREETLLLLVLASGFPLCERHARWHSTDDSSRPPPSLPPAGSFAARSGVLRLAASLILLFPSRAFKSLTVHNSSSSNGKSPWLLRLDRVGEYKKRHALTATAACFNLANRCLFSSFSFWFLCVLEAAAVSCPSGSSLRRSRFFSLLRQQKRQKKHEKIFCRSFFSFFFF